MKKVILSFRVLRPGSYLHRYFFGKAKRRVRNVAVGVAASIVVNFTASAQCNTFRNADAANPLRSVLDTTKKNCWFCFR